MIRLLAGALAALCLVAPSAAQEATDCTALPAMVAALSGSGYAVLGVKPLPNTAARMLYWVDRGRLIGALVGTATDGSPCVADGLLGLGTYIPDQSS